MENSVEKREDCEDVTMKLLNKTLNFMTGLLAASYFLVNFAILILSFSDIIYATYDEVAKINNIIFMSFVFFLLLFYFFKSEFTDEEKTRKYFLYVSIIIIHVITNCLLSIILGS